MIPPSDEYWHSAMGIQESKDDAMTFGLATVRNMPHYQLPVLVAR
jgi:hypothetical protein